MISRRSSSQGKRLALAAEFDPSAQRPLDGSLFVGVLRNTQRRAQSRISFKSYLLHGRIDGAPLSEAFPNTQKFASVSLFARRLNTLAESAILVVTFFDGRCIDKTLDSKRPEVIPSTQVFMLTFK